MTLHYTRDGIATFNATTEKIFRYMSTGNHRHAAFKGHHLVRTSNGVVTVEAEPFEATLVYRAEDNP